jgi:Ca2+-binding EF-hand superfamily protein
MRRPFAVALTAVAALVFGLAQAADAPTFEALDKDADGQISLDEASTHDQLFTAFKDLDRDKDGKLTKAEFAKFKASRATLVP